MVDTEKITEFQKTERLMDLVIPLKKAKGIVSDKILGNVEEFFNYFTNDTLKRIKSLIFANNGDFFDIVLDKYDLMIWDSFVELRLLNSENNWTSIFVSKDIKGSLLIITRLLNIDGGTGWDS